jgi:uncharacterized protein (TIGR02444 family)
VSGTLWDWTLAAYARPGVPEATLALQDEHGFSTARLLWAGWADPDPETLANGVQITVGWDETVLWPLRNVRRVLKTPRRPFDDGAREGLREDVKAAELRAERVLMEALARWLVAVPPAPAKMASEVFERAGVKFPDHVPVPME